MKRFFALVLAVAVIGALNHHSIILKLHCAIYEWVYGLAGDALCNLCTILLVFGLSLMLAAVIRLVGKGCLQRMKA